MSEFLALRLRLRIETFRPAVQLSRAASSMNSAEKKANISIPASPVSHRSPETRCATSRKSSMGVLQSHHSGFPGFLTHNTMPREQLNRRVFDGIKASERSVKYLLR